MPVPAPRAQDYNLGPLIDEEDGDMRYKLGRGHLCYDDPETGKTLCLAFEPNYGSVQEGDAVWFFKKTTSSGILRATDVVVRKRWWQVHFECLNQ